MKAAGWPSGADAGGDYGRVGVARLGRRAHDGALRAGGGPRGLHWLHCAVAQVWILHRLSRAGDLRVQGSGVVAFGDLRLREFAASLLL